MACVRVGPAGPGVAAGARGQPPGCNGSLCSRPDVVRCRFSPGPLPRAAFLPSTPLDAVTGRLRSPPTAAGPVRVLGGTEAPVSRVSRVTPAPRPDPARRGSSESRDARASPASAVHPASRASEAPPEIWDRHSWPRVSHALPCSSVKGLPLRSFFESRTRHHVACRLRSRLLCRTTAPFSGCRGTHRRSSSVTCRPTVTSTLTHSFLRLQEASWGRSDPRVASHFLQTRTDGKRASGPGEVTRFLRPAVPPAADRGPGAGLVRKSLSRPESRRIGLSAWRLPWDTCCTPGR